MILPLVVEPAAVAEAMSDTLRIVDLRPREAWLAAHAPGAVHLEAALLNRADPPVGGLLPDAATVNRIANDIGLADGVHLVACDGGGATEAARLIWVLHAYGFTACSWLNGGMHAWQAAGLPLESGESAPPAPPPEGSGLVPHGDNVVSADELLGELDDPALAVLDVRGAAEYAGTDVRAAMGGHVPGASHLEWTALLDAEGRLLDDDVLRERLAAVEITPERHAVVYCQTHQRSAVTYVALKHLGFDSVRALDGAWSMWGNRPDLPKESGGPVGGARERGKIGL